MNFRRLHRPAAGDHASIIDFWPEYRQHSPEAFFAHYLMMVGAIGGSGCTARGELYRLLGPDGAPMTWEDVFEMRYFSSYIYKTSNVKDLRLQDQFTGRDLLLDGFEIGVLGVGRHGPT